MNTIDFRPNWAWLKFFSRSAQYIHAQYIQYTYNLYYDHTYLIVCSKIFQKLIYGIFSKIGIGSADSFHRSHIAILLFSNAIFLYKNENSKFILRFFFHLCSYLLLKYFPCLFECSRVYYESGFFCLYLLI